MGEKYSKATSVIIELVAFSYINLPNISPANYKNTPKLTRALTIIIDIK